MFNELYKSYQTGAKNRGFVFEISKEQFREITSCRCVYCGAEPSQTLRDVHYPRPRRFNGLYVYNGIDRVDNTKGYVLDNCVPCCKKCNRMKMQLPKSEFLEHIERIYKYQQSFNLRLGE